MNNKMNYTVPIYLDSSANINCSENERLVITTEPIKAARKPRPSYSTIGNGMKTRYFESYPYEETLLELNSNESKLYKLILRGYERNTGYSYVDTSGLSASDKSKLSLGYKGLKQKGLVKRVKQKTYLINPTAKIHLQLFDELWEVWNNLK